MIKQFKNYLKRVSDGFWDFFFKRIDRFPFLKYYPKGRNHIYDILIEEKRNTDFIVFDVGANIGQSALHYNKILKNPKIYSFEPVKSTYDQLVSNTKELSNVACFNFALGSEEKLLEITLSNESGYNSLKKEVFSKFESSVKELIQVKIIDCVAASLGIDKIDILKIDTEGFDLEVIKGSINLLKERKVKYIYCEVAFNGEVDKGDFYLINKFLRTYDFWLCGFYDVSRWGANLTHVSYYNALFKLLKE